MNPSIRSIAGVLGRFGAALSLSVMSTLASAQLVDISNSPLYGGRQPHPNVVVTASVEFPTMGAAYLNVPYSRTFTYSGYFDSSQCYDYQNGNGGFFKPSTPADANHECVNAFSGNFMNWATMSAIDEFRYAMTGGNRVDESAPRQGTIIQRAYLPDGGIPGVPDFYALPSNFPRHSMLLNLIDGAVNATLASTVLPVSALNNALPIFLTNCRSQFFIGTLPVGDCNNPANDLGTYNVRVNVCDNAEGPVRTDLCLQYGGSNGRYKPVGQAQINAASMRFAAFGYLMDRNTTGYNVPDGCNDGSGWSRCRYGGVLRAPMTYVGPTTYDANQTASPNARKEINADGTLVADPEGTASTAGGSYSGFINYINKFGTVTNDPDGSAGSGRNGVYKRYDPAGEMFYEAIRYYQNLGPTDLAAQGNYNNAVKGNFPLTTRWSDPIGSICSSNYIINLADANTWDDTYLPGNPGSPSPGYGRPSSRAVEGGLDAYAWTNRIGMLESTTASITTNDVRPGLANIANQNTANNASRAVAGAAYWANVNDVRDDLAGKQTIRTISVDVAEASIDIHDRQLYLMGKYGGFKNVIDRPTDTFANPFWGPSSADPLIPARTNVEWEDSAGSAYPSNYLLASSPQKLINGLRAAFAQIGSQTGNLSGAALTSANLTYGAQGAYVATFNPSKWSGSVEFDSLSVSNGNLVVSTTPIWSAGPILTARCGTVADASTVCADTDTSANRRIIVTTATVGRIRTAIPFTYPEIKAADLNGYAAMLNTDPATNMSDGHGQERLNYLRGYRADEVVTGLGFRSRDSAMGDIVNSGPVYSGPPTSAIPDSDYQAFYITNAARTPAVYVGANDGMLHALVASGPTGGTELFAYVPGYSYHDLNDLTNPGYTHEVYVDTVPKVQEVKVGSTWKTVLVGANGNGAQGIFALDVTDPNNFGPSNVLFEFSDEDDPDFGSVIATPEFAKLWVSGPATAKVYRYFAVVTGYNKTRTTLNGRPDTSISTDNQNKGVLFLIALDHTLGTPWTLNSDYYKFTFPASVSTQPNGLAPVTLLASKSGDLTTAYMYFGDLQGNLWKLNTSTGNPATWAAVNGGSPIFVAKDGTGARQPITARVELANGPFGSTLVFFGTGKFLGQTDLTVPGAIQSEYSLLDVNPSVTITRANLAQRTAATGACPTGVTGPCLNVSGAAFSYSGSSSKKGWYLDFPSSVSLGERSVTKPAVRTGLLTFTTLTLSNDLCTPGNGYVYQVNALTGLPVAGAGNTIGYASTVGIPGPPRVVDLTLTPGQAQASGEAINLKTQTTLVSGTKGLIGNFGPQTPIKVPPTQQINWREITNWNDKTSP